MRWEKVEQLVGLSESSSGPGKRSSHTCNTIKGGRFIYVFGGFDPINNCVMNQVDVFDTANWIWTRPSINGIPPSAREIHTCTTVKDNLFVFGGTDMDSYLDDLHVLVTSTHTWIHPLVSGQRPQGRDSHSATLVNKHLFIFGGFSSSFDRQVLLNDLYMLNTETFVWTRPEVFGNPPSPRSSHTCSMWNDKLFVICGENLGELYHVSDLHVFDTNTMTWNELQTSGEVLTARSDHVAVSLGKKLFVFGGMKNFQLTSNDLYMIDLVSNVWSKVVTWGESPAVRFSAAGACVDPYKKGVLVFMGGCNDVEDLDDMYFLHTGSLGDAQINPNLAVQSKGKQRKQKCREQRRKLILGKRHFEAMVTEKIPKTIDEKMLHGVLLSNIEKSIEISVPSFGTGEDSLLHNKEKGTVDAEDTNTNTVQP